MNFETRGQSRTQSYVTLAQMWAKALAYINCGRTELASVWAQRLVDALRARGVTIN